MGMARMAHLPVEDDAMRAEKESQNLPPPKVPRSKPADAGHALRKKAPPAQPTALLALNACALDVPSRKIKKAIVHAVDVRRQRKVHHAVGDGEEARGIKAKKIHLKPLLLPDVEGCVTASRSPPMMNIQTDMQPRTLLKVTLGSLKRPRCR